MTAARKLVEDAVEALVALLDALDPDPDLEDSDQDKAVDDDRCDARDSGDDEPWLAGYGINDDDREFDAAEMGEPEDGI